ncbi:hypothetical protein SLS62_010626 [Diatrype stigma]|uniref:Heterokaryon incompatibility domain-containing protein n=1 Tax=Diatrype stigma TaxID=117547 RepID=A0AAN9UB14_9PEZI
MTEYERIYEDIANRPGGPYMRLLTLLPGESSTSAMKATKPEEDWPMQWDDQVGFKGVKPADWSDEPLPSDLEVELSAHPVSDCPEYEALSYTWGRDTDYKFNIKCNGHNFVSLRQMHNALHALRLPDRPRVLWIDAICINQSSYEDKNCQLPLMQHVYRNSKRTVVWLGVRSETNHAPAFSGQADDLRMAPPVLDDFVPSFEKFLAVNIEALATDPEELWQDHAEVKPTWEKRLDLIKESARRVQEDWATRENPPSTDFGVAAEEMMEDTPKILRPAGKFILTRPKFRNHVRRLMSLHESSTWRQTILNLLCREWWSRVWIIQEVCLAPELVFICDDTVVNLDLLFLGMVLYSVFPSDPLYRGHILSTWTLPQVVEYRAMQGQAAGNRPLPGFLHLLTEFRLSDATNPRDHVYALLGLLPPEEQAALEKFGYNPDYSKEVSWCYTETAKVICFMTGNLDFLSISRAPARIASTSPSGNLPSWVPDWAVKVELSTPKHGIEAQGGSGTTAPLFAACGTCDSWALQVRGDEKLLVISGYVADSVTEVTTHSLPFMTDMMDAIMNLMNIENQSEEEIEKMASARGMLGYMGRMLAGIGDTISLMLEWEEFALSKGKSYSTGEDIKRVSCAVRCFGYMPDGPDAAMSAFKEYMDAFWWTRKVYNVTSSSTTTTSPSPPSPPSSSSSLLSKSSLSFFKRKSKESSSDTTSETATTTTTEKSEKDQSDWKRWRQSLVALSAPKDKSKLVKFNALQSFSLGRKLAWTEKGYLALVPEDTAPGDKVVLCRGSKLPLVVKAAGEPNRWKLLESCYVHGIMNGEAWDEGLCEEMELI